MFKSNSNRRALGRASVLALAMAAAAGAAAAQEESGEVDTVFVTAQRVAEDLQDVPLSVTAVGGEKLDVIRSSGGDIRVLSSRIPSVTLESSFGRTFPRPYIRGLGNTDFDLNASQPVSFVYDEVVLENPVLKGFPMFDIERVEALRGPQGTLFGRNTPAGVLKFDSVKPSDTPSGFGRLSYATYGTINAEGAIGGPIVDGMLSGRISGLVQHRDDWVDNTFTGQEDVAEGYDQVALRGQLLLTPNDSFSALFNLHYSDLEGTPRLFRANIIRPGTNDFVAGFDPEKIAQDAEVRSTQEVEYFGGNMRLTFTLGDLELTSITAYESVEAFSRGDIDGGFGAVFAPPSGPGFIPFPAESADGMPDHSQFTQEFRLVGAAGPVKYQVGLFYFDEDVTIESFNYNTLAGGTLNGYAVQQQQTKAYALFGNLDWQVTDALKLSGGLRYSKDEKDFVAEQTISPIGAPPTGPLRANPESDNLSWTLSATYAVTEDVNLYGRVATGYRAPSIQGRLLFGSSLSVADEETVLSWEGGVKAYLFDRRARVNFGVFAYQVEDIQLTAVGGGANFNRLLNADQANGYGFELDVEAKPVENLLITAGLSYNHTELDDPDLATAPCGAPCTVKDPPGALPGTVNIDGNSLPNAPRWVGNLTARYSWPVGDGEIYVFTDWAYRSKINFFLYESVEFTDDRLVEGGLRVGYVAPGGRWEVAAFGRNITDDTSLEGGIDFNNLTGFINDPRTIGVEVKVTLF
ncbi:MAG TPA: TonB-dependent receptor [Caulobacter sp.]|nr:TonB-dependent receptor [Caulobacter sp.]